MAAHLAGHRVAAADRNRFRAIRAEHQQATPTELAAEVQEKGGGRVVHPVKVVEQQEQRPLGRDRCQSAEQLVEEYALGQGPLRQGALGRGRLRQFAVRSPYLPVPNQCCAAGKGGCRNERAYEVGTLFVEACQGQARGGAQPLHPFPPARVPGHAAVKVAEEHLGEPAQGRKGVLAAAGRAARASDEQVRVLGQRRCGESFQQRALSAARVPADKGHPCLAG